MTLIVTVPFLLFFTREITVQLNEPQTALYKKYGGNIIKSVLKNNGINKHHTVMWKEAGLFLAI